MWSRSERTREDASACRFRIDFLVLGVIVAGCAPVQLTSARDAISQHRYSAAHADLVALMRQPSGLGASDRREVADDLCLTEAKIGPPAYTLAQQRLRCAMAASIPGSTSGPELSQINAEMAAADQSDFARAIASGDLADALTIYLHYDAVAGNNDKSIARWRKEIWNLVEAEDTRLTAARGHSRNAALAINRCRGEYPRVRSLGRAEFERWIASETAVDSRPLFAEISVSGGTARLGVGSGSLPALRLNLLKLSEVNDAVIARCKCAGRTNVVLIDKGVPAYLVRISPSRGQSQILILPQ
jgi:hypothetical protein